MSALPPAGQRAGGRSRVFSKVEAIVAGAFAKKNGLRGTSKPLIRRGNVGAAGRIRTHDPLVRSQVLYPTELQPREPRSIAATCALSRGGRRPRSSAPRGPRRPPASASSASASQALRRAAPASVGVGGGLLEQAPRLAPQLALGERGADRERDAPSRGNACAAASSRGSQSAPMPGTRAGQRLRRRAARSSSPSSAEAVPERAQPGARFLGRAERGARASRRARRRTGRAGRRRRSASQSAAQLVDVVRRVERLERERAQQAVRGDRARSPGAWRAAAPSSAPPAAGAPSRAACSFRRSAWVRRATPGGSSASSSSARGASRSSSAHSAASSRAPSSAERAAGLRRDRSSARCSCSSRRARSCRRCALPAASRWPSTVNSLSCASSGVSAWIASARCADFCARL